jgi:DNA polymerase-3 subunit alpha
MSGHPLQRYADLLAAVGARRVQDMTQPDSDVALAGVVTGLRQLKTKRGDRMAVFMLEDEVSSVETVVYPECFARFGGVLADEAMLVVRGKYERDEESSRLVAAEVTLLDSVREKAVRAVEITLAGKRLDRPVIRELANILDRHPGDRRVSVVIELNGGRPLRVRTATARRIRPSETFVRDVEAVCGAGSVVLK